MEEKLLVESINFVAFLPHIWVKVLSYRLI